MSTDNIQIKPGMIVWLKSSGPAMTVKQDNGYGNWICTWFVDTEVKEHSFSPSQLTDQDPNPPIMIV